MSFEVRFQSRFAHTVVALICAFALIAVAVYFKRNTTQEAVGKSIEGGMIEASRSEQYFGHVVSLDVDSSDKEAGWASALSELLRGQPEYSIDHGRIDVITETLAIEVDRFSKWHEGLGQAVHYGMASNRLPTLALFLDDSYWPLSDASLTKLHIIEAASLSAGVKLLVLRSSRRIESDV